MLYMIWNSTKTLCRCSCSSRMLPICINLPKRRRENSVTPCEHAGPQWRLSHLGTDLNTFSGQGSWVYKGSMYVQIYYLLSALAQDLLFVLEPPNPYVHLQT